MMKLLRFSAKVRKMTDSFLEGKTGFEDLILKYLHEEQLNAKLLPVHEFIEMKLRTVDRIILFFLFDMLLDWRTGTSFNRDIKPLLGKLKNPIAEFEAFTDCEGKLFDKLLIQLSYNENYDDYYVELTNDCLLTFLYQDQYPFKNTLKADIHFFSVN